MPKFHQIGLNTFGIIFYGFLAGSAAATIIVLGPIFLGLFIGWIFNQVGWEQAGGSAMVGGLGSVYYTVIPGLIVGVIVCLRVWITCLRDAP
jgi:hypothetical protein